MSCSDHTSLPWKLWSDCWMPAKKTRAITVSECERWRLDLAGSSFLENAAQIVYAHQERYDGSGYPRGLRNEEICLGARIFAVIDAYDAMRTNRVYRDALPEKEVIAEIKKQRGRQFDPEVVDAFLRCSDELGKICETWQV